MTLDEALDALLRGRPVHDVDDEDREALATLDQDELARTRAKIRREALTRRHRGVGAIVDVFPGTIAAWRAAHPGDVDLDELAARFVASDAYGAHRELPFAGPGTSIEEAFLRFAEATALGEPGLRTRECLRGLLKALTISPEPSFSVPPEVQRVPGGWLALAPGGTVFAAIGGRYLEGQNGPASPTWKASSSSKSLKS